jgi:hypothetical protein
VQARTREVRSSLLIRFVVTNRIDRALLVFQGSSK